MRYKWSRAFLSVMCLAILSACGGSDTSAPSLGSQNGLSTAAIATGTSHSCALLANRTVSCWGANDRGQLGNATTNISPTPQMVTGLSNVVAIAASGTFVIESPSAGLEGGNHSCALLADETVRCWGDNEWGQLGPQASPSPPCRVSCSSNPIDIGLTRVSSIATGGAHSCALLADGTVSCWGANDRGQLGNGAFTFSSPPVKVNQLTNVIAIATGAGHSCALLADGTVWCWGDNSTGQLGPQVTADGCRGIPFGDHVPCSVNPVAIGLSRVVGIAAGHNYTCARLTDTTVNCWGANDRNQLGRDSSPGTTRSSIPAPVTGLRNVVDITAGGSSSSIHTCARLADTTVRCWGTNGDGQLGNTTPTPGFTPVPVIGLSNVAAIATGGSHSCALLADGTVWCWGSNDNIQLGDGRMIRSTTSVPVRSLSNVAAITVGNGHTCVVLTDSTVNCWGGNERGQLGRDTSLGTTLASIPAPVTALTNVTTIAAGNGYTCAVLTDKTVTCWGVNSSNQLGPNVPLNPTTNKPLTESLTPVPVGLSNVDAIAASLDHTCALLADTTVKCWGDNSLTPVDIGLKDVGAISAGGNDCAVLKNGSVYCWSFGQPPQPVELSAQAIAVVAGNDHRCALLTDTTVWCWGLFNDTGELGNGTFTDSASPVRVVNLVNVAAIDAGDHHNCTILFSGTVSCWGVNERGQLGNGTTNNSPIPQVVTGLSNVAAIAANNGHTCARLADGTVSCWGDNLSGELGNGVIFSTFRPLKVVGIPQD